MENPKDIFKKTYDKYVKKIYRFIFLKVSSKEAAEDLTSETFLRFLNTLENSKEEVKNEQAFLYRIARNLTTDYYREKGKANFVSVDSFPIADSKESLEERIMVNSDMDMVKASLAGMKEEHQNVIIWRYLDEMSIPEIAGIIEKTEPATRVMLHRALNSLKKTMNNKHKTA